MPPKKRRPKAGAAQNAKPSHTIAAKFDDGSKKTKQKNNWAMPTSAPVPSVGKKAKSAKLADNCPFDKGDNQVQLVEDMVPFQYENETFHPVLIHHGSIQGGVVPDDGEGATNAGKVQIKVMVSYAYVGKYFSAIVKNTPESFKVMETHKHPFQRTQSTRVRLMDGSVAKLSVGMLKENKKKSKKEAVNTMHLQTAGTFLRRYADHNFDGDTDYYYFVDSMGQGKRLKTVDFPTSISPVKFPRDLVPYMSDTDYFGDADFTFSAAPVGVTPEIDDKYAKSNNLAYKSRFSRLDKFASPGSEYWSVYKRTNPSEVEGAEGPRTSEYYKHGDTLVLRHVKDKARYPPNQNLSTPVPMSTFRALGEATTAFEEQYNDKTETFGVYHHSLHAAVVKFNSCCQDKCCTNIGIVTNRHAYYSKAKGFHDGPNHFVFNIYSGKVNTHVVVYSINNKLAADCVKKQPMCVLCEKPLTLFTYTSDPEDCDLVFFPSYQLTKKVYAVDHAKKKASTVSSSDITITPFTLGPFKKGPATLASIQFDKFKNPAFPYSKEVMLEEVTVDPSSYTDSSTQYGSCCSVGLQDGNVTLFLDRARLVNRVINGEKTDVVDLSHFGFIYVAMVDGEMRLRQSVDAPGFRDAPVSDPKDQEDGNAQSKVSNSTPASEFTPTQPKKPRTLSLPSDTAKCQDQRFDVELELPQVPGAKEEHNEQPKEKAKHQEVKPQLQLNPFFRGPEGQKVQPEAKSSEEKKEEPQFVLNLDGEFFQGDLQGKNDYVEQLDKQEAEPEPSQVKMCISDFAKEKEKDAVVNGLVEDHYNKDDESQKRPNSPVIRDTNVKEPDILATISEFAYSSEEESYKVYPDMPIKSVCTGIYEELSRYRESKTNVNVKDLIKGVQAGNLSDAVDLHKVNVSVVRGMFQNHVVYTRFTHKTPDDKNPKVYFEGLFDQYYVTFGMPMGNLDPTLNPYFLHFICKEMVRILRADTTQVLEWLDKSKPILDAAMFFTKDVDNEVNNSGKAHIPLNVPVVKPCNEHFSEDVSIECLRGDVVCNHHAACKVAFDSKVRAEQDLSFLRITLQHKQPSGKENVIYDIVTAVCDICPNAATLYNKCSLQYLCPLHAPSGVAQLNLSLVVSSEAGVFKQTIPEQPSHVQNTFQRVLYDFFEFINGTGSTLSDYQDVIYQIGPNRCECYIAVTSIKEKRAALITDLENTMSTLSGPSAIHQVKRMLYYTGCAYVEALASEMREARIEALDHNLDSYCYDHGIDRPEHLSILDFDTLYELVDYCRDRPYICPRLARLVLRFYQAIVEYPFTHHAVVKDGDYTMNTLSDNRLEHNYIPKSDVFSTYPCCDLRVRCILFNNDLWLGTGEIKIHTEECNQYHPEYRFVPCHLSHDGVKFWCRIVENFVNLEQGSETVNTLYYKSEMYDPHYKPLLNFAFSAYRIAFFDFALDKHGKQLAHLAIDTGLRFSDVITKGVDCLYSDTTLANFQFLLDKMIRCNSKLVEEVQEIVTPDRVRTLIYAFQESGANHMFNSITMENMYLEYTAQYNERFGEHHPCNFEANHNHHGQMVVRDNIVCSVSIIKSKGKVYFLIPKHAFYYHKALQLKSIIPGHFELRFDKMDSMKDPVVYHINTSTMQKLHCFEVAKDVLMIPYNEISNKEYLFPKPLGKLRLGPVKVCSDMGYCTNIEVVGTEDKPYIKRSNVKSGRILCQDSCIVGMIVRSGKYRTGFVYNLEDPKYSLDGCDRYKSDPPDDKVDYAYDNMGTEDLDMSDHFKVKKRRIHDDYLEFATELLDETTTYVNSLHEYLSTQGIDIIKKPSPYILYESAIEALQHLGKAYPETKQATVVWTAVAKGCFDVVFKYGYLIGAESLLRIAVEYTNKLGRLLKHNQSVALYDSAVLLSKSDKPNYKSILKCMFIAVTEVAVKVNMQIYIIDLKRAYIHNHIGHNLFEHFIHLLKPNLTEHQHKDLLSFRRSLDPLDPLYSCEMGIDCFDDELPPYEPLPTEPPPKYKSTNDRVCEIFCDCYKILMFVVVCLSLTALGAIVFTIVQAADAQSIQPSYSSSIWTQSSHQTAQPSQVPNYPPSSIVPNVSNATGNIALNGSFVQDINHNHTNSFHPNTTQGDFSYHHEIHVDDLFGNTFFPPKIRDRRELPVIPPWFSGLLAKLRVNTLPTSTPPITHGTVLPIVGNFTNSNFTTHFPSNFTTGLSTPGYSRNSSNVSVTPFTTTPHSLHRKRRDILGHKANYNNSIYTVGVGSDYFTPYGYYYNQIFVSDTHCSGKYFVLNYVPDLIICAADMSARYHAIGLIPELQFTNVGEYKTMKRRGLEIPLVGKFSFELFHTHNYYWQGTWTRHKTVCHPIDSGKCEKILFCSIPGFVTGETRAEFKAFGNITNYAFYYDFDHGGRYYNVPDKNGTIFGDPYQAACDRTPGADVTLGYYYGCYAQTPRYRSLQQVNYPAGKWACFDAILPGFGYHFEHDYVVFDKFHCKKGFKFVYVHGPAPNFIRGQKPFLEFNTTIPCVIPIEIPQNGTARLIPTNHRICPKIGPCGYSIVHDYRNNIDDSDYQIENNRVYIKLRHKRSTISMVGSNDTVDCEPDKRCYLDVPNFLGEYGPKIITLKFDGGAKHLVFFAGECTPSTNPTGQIKYWFCQWPWLSTVVTLILIVVLIVLLMAVLPVIHLLKAFGNCAKKAKKLSGKHQYRGGDLEPLMVFAIILIICPTVTARGLYINCRSKDINTCTELAELGHDVESTVPKQPVYPCKCNAKYSAPPDVTADGGGKRYEVPRIILGRKKRSNCEVTEPTFKFTPPSPKVYDYTGHFRVMNGYFYCNAKDHLRYIATLVRTNSFAHCGYFVDRCTTRANGAYSSEGCPRIESVNPGFSVQKIPWRFMGDKYPKSFAISTNEDGYHCRTLDKNKPMAFTYSTGYTHYPVFLPFRDNLDTLLILGHCDKTHGTSQAHPSAGDHYNHKVSFADGVCDLRYTDSKAYFSGSGTILEFKLYRENYYAQEGVFVSYYPAAHEGEHNCGFLGSGNHAYCSRVDGAVKEGVNQYLRVKHFFSRRHDTVELHVNSCCLEGLVIKATVPNPVSPETPTKSPVTTNIITQETTPNLVEVLERHQKTNTPPVTTQVPIVEEIPTTIPARVKKEVAEIISNPVILPSQEPIAIREVIKELPELSQKKERQILHALLYRDAHINLRCQSNHSYDPNYKVNFPLLPPYEGTRIGYFKIGNVTKNVYVEFVNKESVAYQAAYGNEITAIFRLHMSGVYFPKHRYTACFPKQNGSFYYQRMGLMRCMDNDCGIECDRYGFEPDITSRYAHNGIYYFKYFFKGRPLYMPIVIDLSVLSCQHIENTTFTVYPKLYKDYRPGNERSVYIPTGKKMCKKELDRGIYGNEIVQDFDVCGYSAIGVANVPFHLEVKDFKLYVRIADSMATNDNAGLYEIYVIPAGTVNTFYYTSHHPQLGDKSFSLHLQEYNNEGSRLMQVIVKNPYGTERAYYFDGYCYHNAFYKLFPLHFCQSSPILTVAAASSLIMTLVVLFAIFKRSRKQAAVATLMSKIMPLDAAPIEIPKDVGEYLFPSLIGTILVVIVLFALYKIWGARGVILASLPCCKATTFQDPHRARTCLIPLLLFSLMLITRNKRVSLLLLSLLIIYILQPADAKAIELHRARNGTASYDDSICVNMYAFLWAYQIVIILLHLFCRIWVFKKCKLCSYITAYALKYNLRGKVTFKLSKPGSEAAYTKLVYVYLFSLGPCVSALEPTKPMALPYSVVVTAVVFVLDGIFYYMTSGSCKQIRKQLRNAKVDFDAEDIDEITEHNFRDCEIRPESVKPTRGKIQIGLCKFVIAMLLFCRFDVVRPDNYFFNAGHVTMKDGKLLIDHVANIRLPIIPGRHLLNVYPTAEGKVVKPKQFTIHILNNKCNYVNSHLYTAFDYLHHLPDGSKAIDCSSTETKSVSAIDCDWHKTKKSDEYVIWKGKGFGGSFDHCRVQTMYKYQQWHEFLRKHCVEGKLRIALVPDKKRYATLHNIKPAGRYIKFKFCDGDKCEYMEYDTNAITGKDVNGVHVTAAGALGFYCSLDGEYIASNGTLYDAKALPSFRAANPGVLGDLASKDADFLKSTKLCPVDFYSPKDFTTMESAKCDIHKNTGGYKAFELAVIQKRYSTVSQMVPSVISLSPDHMEVETHNEIQGMVDLQLRMHGVEFGFEDIPIKICDISVQEMNSEPGVIGGSVQKELKLEFACSRGGESYLTVHPTGATDDLSVNCYGSHGKKIVKVKLYDYTTTVTFGHGTCTGSAKLSAVAPKAGVNNELLDHEIAGKVKVVDKGLNLDNALSLPNVLGGSTILIAVLVVVAIVICHFATRYRSNRVHYVKLKDSM